MRDFLIILGITALCGWVTALPLLFAGKAPGRLKLQLAMLPAAMQPSGYMSSVAAARIMPYAGAPQAVPKFCFPCRIRIFFMSSSSVEIRFP